MKHQNKTQVNQLGLDLWRDVVVRNKRIWERLRSTLLGLVHRERAGEVIGRALMRNITTVRVARLGPAEVLGGRRNAVGYIQHEPHGRQCLLHPLHFRIQKDGMHRLPWRPCMISLAWWNALCCQALTGP